MESLWPILYANLFCMNKQKNLSPYEIRSIIKKNTINTEKVKSPSIFNQGRIQSKLLTSLPKAILMTGIIAPILTNSANVANKELNRTKII